MLERTVVTMDEVARLSPRDRADLFLTAAAQAGLTPRIVEKDFWVCWSLRRLFTLSDPKAGLLFKGGTSLSKVYNAIKRFSEDVDLSFNRADLGYPDTDELIAMSRKQRDAKLEALSARCRELVTGEYLTRLQADFTTALRGPASDWELTAADADDSGQTLLFRYPRAVETLQPNNSGYVIDAVRLEFGARSDSWPAEDKTVTAYAAEQLPEQFRDSTVHVHVLAAERTFWEKATILHMWHHAPADKPFRDRQSRHYYDLAMLVGQEIGTKALANHALLLDVAKHKSVFFQSGWASYDTAKPGTLRLLPKPDRLDALKKDYAVMRSEMLFDSPPTFDEVIATLTRAERLVNS